jgi:Methyltransferase FkbM domain
VSGSVRCRRRRRGSPRYVRDAGLCRKIRIINKVVAGQGGRDYYVSTPSPASLGARARPRPRLRDQTYYRLVETVSFDELLRDTRPSVVKMDIEGCEFECLDGATILPSVQYLLVEFHGKPEKAAPILRQVISQGFTPMREEAYRNWDLMTVMLQRKAIRATSQYSKKELAGILKIAKKIEKGCNLIFEGYCKLVGAD